MQSWRVLNLAGIDESQLLSAQVWIADMRLFEDHNSVWNEWVDPANASGAGLPHDRLLATWDVMGHKRSFTHRSRGTGDSGDSRLHQS
jgi:hypothetical protein